MKIFQNSSKNVVSKRVVCACTPYFLRPWNSNLILLWYRSYAEESFTFGLMLGQKIIFWSAFKLIVEGLAVNHQYIFIPMYPVSRFLLVRNTGSPILPNLRHLWPGVFLGLVTPRQLFQEFSFKERWPWVCPPLNLVQRATSLCN